MGKPTFYLCGICEMYHSAKFVGDCRQGDVRHNLEDLDKFYGETGWDEVDMEDVDVVVERGTQ